MKKWYVIKTKSNQEMRAIKNLLRQHFNVFCPFIPNRLNSQNSSKIKKPLFPSYLFIELDIFKDEWLKINNTYGVSEILKSSSCYPESIPSEFIQSLKKLTDNFGYIKFDYFKIKLGDRVKFVEGPFVNKICEVINMSSKNRVLLLLKIFTKDIKILVNEEYITPI